MTAKGKSGTGKGKVRTLRVRKHTVKDLDTKGKGKQVKGGGLKTIPITYCLCKPTVGCEPAPTRGCGIG